MEHNRGYLESILKGFRRYKTEGGWIYNKDFDREMSQNFKIFESSETKECYIITSYINNYPSYQIRSQKDIFKLSACLKDLELVEQELINKGFKKL